MTDLATELYGLPPNLQAVSNAILNQESGNNPNSPTSVDGAVGRAQIIPATFKQYALPGEDINNPADNLAVHNRIIANLASKSGNDPARIAAGYFSGPGNIAPLDAATPYKADRADGNGKKVSSYVADVVKRLNPIGTANAGEVTPPVGKPQPVGADDLVADLYGNPPASAPAQPESIIQKRGQQGWDAINAYQQGQQSLPETALQIFGKSGAGTVSDATGWALKHLYDNIVPDQQRKNLASHLQQFGQDTGITDLAKSAANSYGQFAQNNPRAARNIESVADIFGAIPAASAENAAASGLSDVGSVLEASGQSSAQAAKNKFIQSLVTPKETASVLNDQFGRSTETKYLKQQIVQPTPQEQGAIDTVSQIPGISKNKSLLANHNIIEDAKNDKAQSLIDKLKSNDVPINSTNVANSLDEINEGLKKNPYISGTGETAATRVMDGMLESLRNNPRTASGLLQARKDFDKWVTEQKGENAFDPSLDSPTTIAIRKFRQAINNTVSDAVPDAEVRASLAQQSNMYHALENIRSKGSLQAKNAVSRAGQKVTSVLPKSLVAKAGLAGLAGGALYAASPIVAGGLALYGAQKAIRSPALRIGLGKTLKTTGNILK